MTMLREKIGQMFMISVQGEAMTRDERLIIEKCSFGGFILFDHNCREPKQILSLCRVLWETATERPPLIATDQEGGRVHRLPEPFTHFPAAARIGATGNSEIRHRNAESDSEVLLNVRANDNVAPVLDVNSNP